MATWGVCRAAATCMRPESLVTNTSHSPISAMASTRLVRPVRSTIRCRFLARSRISVAVGWSAALPNTRIQPPVRSLSRSANSA